jgi:phi13 family phage major tail protein
MTQINKTQYGLKKLGFALRDSENLTYGNIYWLPGAISLGLTRNDNAQTLAADDGEYDRGKAGKTVTGDLNVALFNEDWLTKVLGHYAVGGGIAEGDGTSAEFALVGQVSGDQGGYRFVWYGCTATDPTTTHQTIEVDGTINYATETCTITSKTVELSSGDSLRSFKCEKGTANYDSFFDAIYIPPQVQ